MKQIKLFEIIISNLFFFLSSDRKRYPALGQLHFRTSKNATSDQQYEADSLRAFELNLLSVKFSVYDNKGNV